MFICIHVHIVQRLSTSLKMMTQLWFLLEPTLLPRTHGFSSINNWIQMHFEFWSSQISWLFFSWCTFSIFSEHTHRLCHYSHWYKKNLPNCNTCYPCTIVHFIYKSWWWTIVAFTWWYKRVFQKGLISPLQNIDS